MRCRLTPDTSHPLTQLDHLTPCTSRLTSDTSRLSRSWTSSYDGTEILVRADGREASLLVFGTVLHLLVVLVTNLKLSLTMHMYSRLQLAAIVLCVLAWCLTLA